jgi:hypothetical protein
MVNGRYVVLNRPGLEPLIGHFATPVSYTGRWMPPLRNGLRRFAAMVGLSVWWSPMTLHSRIESPPSTVDLTRFVSEAPIIFRGVVLNVSVTEGRQLPLAAVAQLRVQRWYRGEGGSEARVYYQTGFRIPGHDCIGLKPGGHWLIFAAQQNGRLKFIDDCYAAVAVSPEMAPTHDPLNVFAQIGADFAAGLGDSEKAGRIVSLQRLGGLRTALSLPAIHRVIDHGNLEEKDWATYAALRSGDTTVLSRVREMFARADSDVPRYYLAWELGQLRDKSDSWLDRNSDCFAVSRITKVCISRPGQ